MSKEKELKYENRLHIINLTYKINRTIKTTIKIMASENKILNSKLRLKNKK